MNEISNYCYIGPTVARIGLKHCMLVLGAEPPPQLKNLIDLKPVIGVLFLPTSKVAVARQKMGVRGSIENVAAEEVLNYNAELMARERQKGS